MLSMIVKQLAPDLNIPQIQAQVIQFANVARATADQVAATQVVVDMLNGKVDIILGLLTAVNASQTLLPEGNENDHHVAIASPQQSPAAGPGGPSSVVD